MRARGKVLREPAFGPGLLMIDGQQFRFWLDGVWHSEVAPRPGLAVSVELNRELQVVGITAIPEGQLEEKLAQEVAPATRDEKKGFASRLIAKFVGRRTGTF